MTPIDDPWIARLALLTLGCIAFVIILGIYAVVEGYLEQRQWHRNERVKASLRSGEWRE